MLGRIAVTGRNALMVTYLLSEPKVAEREPVIFLSDVSVFLKLSTLKSEEIATFLLSPRSGILSLNS